MVRIACCFAGGVVLGRLAPDCLTATETTYALFFCFLSLAALLLLRNRGTVVDVPFGIVSMTALALLGYLRQQRADERIATRYFGNLQTPIEALHGVVADFPVSKSRGLNFPVRVEAVRSANQWIAATGLVQVTVALDSPTETIGRGDKLLIRGKPIPVRGPLNPGEFDYRAFLANAGIHHTLRVNFGAVHLSEQTAWYHWGLLQQWRNHCISVFKRYIPDPPVRAIAEALVLGVTEEMTRDLTNTYADTGTIHVLAVSGLHIGIIYLILRWLCFPLKHFAHGRWIIAALTTSCLWTYAMLTGLSPSVLRAVAMFTFLAVAKPFGRRVPPANVLASSAMVLLLANPGNLFMVGFQLSYLAVAGIIVFYNPILRWFNPTGAIARHLWQNTALSLSAQLTTFVPCLYYFHQFPVWFLLANLLIVPLSFAVLILGLVLLALNSIPCLDLAIAWLLIHCISLMNVVAALIQQMPVATIQGVTLTLAECSLLAGTLIALAISLLQRTFFPLWIASGCALAFASLQVISLSHSSGRFNLTVYAIPAHHAVSVVTDNNSTCWLDTALRADHPQFQRCVRPNLVSLETSENKSLHIASGDLPGGGTVLICKGRMMLMVETNTAIQGGGLHPDWIVVNGWPRNGLPQKLGWPGLTIVLSGRCRSTDRWKARAWAAQTRATVYDVTLQGALQYSW